MGDYFTTITDVEATAEDAERLSENVGQRLIERGIILANKTDCVLGVELGYPPGPNAREAIEDADQYFEERRTSGLDVVTARHVQWTTQLEVWYPHCQYTMVHWSPPTPKEQENAWMAAVDEWYKGGAGLLRCPECGRSSSINEYQQGEFPWGFGNLACVFWNWDRLKPAFIEEIAALLGHKVVVSADKL